MACSTGERKALDFAEGGTHLFELCMDALV